jgi:hypothetical protein
VATIAVTQMAATDVAQITPGRLQTKKFAILWSWYCLSRSMAMYTDGYVRGVPMDVLDQLVHLLPAAEHTGAAEDPHVGRILHDLGHHLEVARDHRLALLLVLPSWPA